MFHPSACGDGTGAVYFRITHQGKVRRLATPYKVLKTEWDEKRSRVFPDRAPERNRLSVHECILRDIERLARIDRKLADDGRVYSADDIVDEFRRHARMYSLFNFTEGLIAALRDNGRMRTAETYRAALNSFRKYRNNEDIMLDCLSTDVMEAYEAWLKSRHVTPNTISFYSRILRAVYNRAVDNDIIEDRRPFRHVYTGVDKTVKRALPLVVISRIKTLDLTLKPSLDYARDMFLISFYLRGMSFVDMAFLKKSDLRNACITYRRRKTGRRLTIGWTKDMQSILDKYPENSSDYLLPIIRHAGTNERNTYRNAGYNINHNLKQIATMAGIDIPLTLYVARHSWASAAKAKGIPLSVISEGMGHDSEVTTQIYLAGLDTSVIDHANALILSSI